MLEYLGVLSLGDTGRGGRAGLNEDSVTPVSAPSHYVVLGN